MFELVLRMPDFQPWTCFVGMSAGFEAWSRRAGTAYGRCEADKWILWLLLCGENKSKSFGHYRLFGNLERRPKNEKVRQFFMG